ncbi:rab3 GTPase-activating protein non-catalytic subunit [Episyrphus balteatus]|uniref:rab3 GTPase-activating protein non-catalytic subunit n=1 Tax=Episyrphus balteatus TaxID=286459 RepID=UPI00248641B8|nr:rab3 GTPase-activating protein non-catalytic subunit [Episyrphus balteatus]
MACEVKTFASIKDFHKVQEFFGLTHDESWLNAVQYAISPTSELIALALGEKLALLSSQWDNKSQLATFAPSWSGEIVNQNEIITSVICLPMYGKNVSSGAEWTCVAVGLSSGFVNFYTETGIKLFSQQCHDSAVYGIKSLYKRASEESHLYILYDIGVCIFKGDDLFPFLVSKKNHLGHNTEPAYGSKYFGDLESPEMIPYQKFKYPKDRECVINDTVVAGPVKPRTFDHIVQQSLSSGVFAKVGDFPTQSSLVLGVGTEPFLGLYYAEEGYKTISVGDVAKDVLGMVYKNVLGGFFSSKPAPNTPEEQPAGKETSMRSGSKIYDGKRDGFSIWIAPGNQLAVIADNLDRVILIDCRRGVALRVWKGYRDAQCAFVKVKEKTLKGDKSDRRRALFLIIYAPRMGCLEIWGMQNGPKVAAFTVSKNGMLAYTTHGLMGVATGARCKATINSCLFLDPSDQSLKEITIPFHFALREANSKTARDIHLVRRLKTLLREDPDNCNRETVSEICCDFQTDEVRLQCLEMMTKNKKMPPEFFAALVHSFTSESNEKLKQLLEFYRRLTDFYIAMRNPPKEEEKTYETLSLSDNDLETIEQIMELLADRPSSNAQATQSKVTFQVKHQQDGEFVEYLRVFNSNDGQPQLNHDKSALFGCISENLFRNCFKGRFCEQHFKEAAEASELSSEDLIVLALNFWLEKTFNYNSREEIINDMMHLGTIVHAICDLAGDKVKSFTYNSICPWWQAVRELLLESPRSLSLMVAIVCRTVAKTIRRSQNDGSCEEGEEEVWEQISQDEAQWSLLIGKLDDIAVLGAILESPMLSLDPTMTELPYETPDCSLKAIVTKGKGVVSDLATKWLLYSRIHPTKILEREDSADQDDEPVPKRLQVLRRHFPFSLESGVILSLMSWEYMVHWSKDLQSLDHMRASLICLGTFKEPDYALKHGMCCMIWNATIKYPLQSTMKMIQKAGRVPDDKICQQEVGIGASLVADFLDLCLEFLMHFDISMSHRKRELKFEEILSDGQLPLHYIALQRNHAIQEILQLHIELSRVLQFIVFFQMKFSKPITTLFDAMANKTFFVEINKELPYVLPEADMVLQKHREDFLCRVVTASMDLIREDLERLYVVEHTCWMEKVYELAELWKLERTGIKRHQIVEMYAHGWDSYANDLLRDMVDDMEMGKLLVEIAGRRMNLFAKTSGERFSKIASVGQQLLNYLDNLNDNKSKGIQITATSPDEIDLISLTKLTTVAYECLSKKESKYLHIAGQMFDACSVLQE